MNYKREQRMDDGQNILDFIVEDKLILETKAKRLIARGDFYQLQRYLQMSGKKLGLIVNFRNRYIKPVRIIRVGTDNKKRFV